MAFRAVRTVASLTLLLLLAAGCQPEPAADGDAARLPADTVRLGPDQLARLPWYGVQHLPCDTVRRFLRSRGDTIPTDTIRIRVSRDSLEVVPSTVVVRRGDTLWWSAPDSIVWTARFMDDDPYEGGPVASAMGGRGTAGGATGRVISEGSETCGRYYFFVAAYHMGQPDRIHLLDPPKWVY